MSQQTASAWIAIVYAGIVILLLTAPTWGPWIDGICK